MDFARLVAGQEPQADRDLRCAEQLARQRNDALDEIGSTRLRRISPSPDCCDDSEPFVMTVTIVPIGTR
jgi:hypothetical protein